MLQLNVRLVSESRWSFRDLAASLELGVGALTFRDVHHDRDRRKFRRLWRLSTSDGIELLRIYAEPTVPGNPDVQIVFRAQWGLCFALSETERFVNRFFDFLGLPVAALTLSRIELRLDMPHGVSRADTYRLSGHSVRRGRNGPTYTCETEQGRLTSLRSRSMKGDRCFRIYNRSVAPIPSFWNAVYDHFGMHFPWRYEVLLRGRGLAAYQVETFADLTEDVCTRAYRDFFTSNVVLKTEGGGIARKWTHLQQVRSMIPLTPIDVVFGEPDRGLVRALKEGQIPLAEPSRTAHESSPPVASSLALLNTRQIVELMAAQLEVHNEGFLDQLEERARLLLHGDAHNQANPFSLP